LSIAQGYTPVSDSFLHNITLSKFDFDPQSGNLLSPILIPRVPGTSNHSLVQIHFTNFFNTQLPKWKTEWYNSTAASSTGTKIPISNLVFSREPPWTKPGQANFLTLAAHYDSMGMLEGSVGAADGAVPCAILMHVARYIDGFMTQMHDEMDALGEGGEIEMDMGVQIVFLDGKEGFVDGDLGLYGSR
jgi:glutaminyl-peptide cyclotransferase